MFGQIQYSYSSFLIYLYPLRTWDLLTSLVSPITPISLWSKGIDKLPLFIPVQGGPFAVQSRLHQLASYWVWSQAFKQGIFSSVPINSTPVPSTQPPSPSTQPPPHQLNQSTSTQLIPFNSTPVPINPNPSPRQLNPNPHQINQSPSTQPQ